MNGEVNTAVGELAKVCLGIAITGTRTFISAFACVMAASSFGYHITMMQVFIAMFAIATIRMKTVKEDGKTPEQRINEEFGKLIAASIFTFVIWLLA